MTVADEYRRLDQLLLGQDLSSDYDSETMVALRAAVDLMDPPQVRLQGDPVAWVSERLKYDLWSKQREIIESVRDYHQVAVYSCHDIGKSFTAASTALWWIDTHPVGDAFVVTTAPTHQQVMAILWREMNRLHVRGGLAGRMNLLEWYFGNELVGFGRKPADYDPAAFQGIHSIYVLVIFDEACGIPKALWDAASTLVANEDSRFLAVGNPDDPHGEFARVCRPNSGWKTIHVGSKDSPNFTGEEVDPRISAALISKRWAEEKKKSWGENSALYTSKVKGLFPADSDAGVVPYSWATACKYVQLPAEGKRCAGLDVGGGGDRTVLRERIGSRAGREEVWIESDPMKVCGEIALKLSDWEIDRVVVDTIGIGWGLAGRLKELSKRHNRVSKDSVHNAEIVGFNAAARSNQPDRFINKRAELHWEVGRELSRLKTWDLEDVADDTLAELTEAQYEVMDSRGKIKVEAKEKVIERLGRSPDSADALLMAFWEGDSAEMNLPATARVLTSEFYDPRQEQGGPGWAGPKREKVSVSTKNEVNEELILREILANRPN